MKKSVYQRDQLSEFNHAGPIREVLGYRINNGISRMSVLLCFVIVIILAIGLGLKIPDSTPGVISFKFTEPGEDLIPIIDGKIKRVYFQNGDRVEPGTIIAVLENEASTTDVLNLSAEINSLLEDSLYNEYKPKTYLQLGKLQKDYEKFLFDFFSKPRISIDKNIQYRRRMSYLIDLYHLKSRIDEWKNTYLLSAKSGGYLFFQDKLVKGSKLKRNVVAFTIQNKPNPQMVGEVKLSRNTTSNIKSGQRIVFSFEDGHGALNRGTSEVLSKLDKRSNEEDMIFITPKFNLIPDFININVRSLTPVRCEIMAEDQSLFSRVLRTIKPKFSRLF